LLLSIPHSPKGKKKRGREPCEKNEKGGNRIRNRKEKRKKKRLLRKPTLLRNRPIHREKERGQEQREVVGHHRKRKRAETPFFWGKTPLQRLSERKENKEKKKKKKPKKKKNAAALPPREKGNTLSHTDLG